MVRGEALNSAVERQWDDLRDPAKTILAQGDIRRRPVLDEVSLKRAGAEAGALWNLHRYAERTEPVAPDADDPKLSEALALYLKLHDKGSDATFIKVMRHAISQVTDNLGDKPLVEYSRQDARKVADKLSTGLKTKTVRVYLSRISAVFNRGLKEWQLSCTNPFVSLDLKHEGRDSKKVETFTFEELEMIASACITADNEVAWVSAMQMAPGARVQEISRESAGAIIPQ
jgi:hypothetical protein